MSAKILSTSWIAAALLGTIGLCGCQHASVADDVVSHYSADTLDAQMEFWHQLNDVPFASNDDAFHAVLLYLDGNDPSADYAARVSTLKSRQLLPADFNQSAKQAIERGTLAVVIARSLNIKGGMMLHLANTSPRYAVRELYYEQIYPLSSPQQTFSGAELVGIIGRVEDYQRGDPADRPAAELPGDAHN